VNRRFIHLKFDEGHRFVLNQGKGHYVDRGKECRAFRAQLVVPEQRQLYDFWMTKAAGRDMPSRAEIRPTEIPRILPGISLIDVAPNIGHSLVRLAGTRLREIHDREITGLQIEDLDWGDKRDYWMAAYHRTIVEKRPTQGIVKGPRLHKEHVVQYWLKLPLSNDGNTVNMVLCYDYFIMASQATAHEKIAAGA
jgi:hypothetical protein